jgi:hypothetical protein
MDRHRPEMDHNREVHVVGPAATVMFEEADNAAFLSRTMAYNIFHDTLSH